MNAQCPALFRTFEMFLCLKEEFFFVLLFGMVIEILIGVQLNHRNGSIA